MAGIALYRNGYIQLPKTMISSQTQAGTQTLTTERMQSVESKPFGKLLPEEIQAIREKLADRELVREEELGRLKKEQITASKDVFALVRLFFFCHDTLIGILQSLGDDRFALESYLNQFKTVSYLQLRSLYVDFGSGEHLGDYYTELRMNRLVANHRIEMNDLIAFFFDVGRQDF